MLNFVQHLLLRSSFILESVIGSLYGRGPRGPALSSQPTSWPHTAHDWPTKWLVNQESWSCPLHYHAKLGLLTQKPFVRTTQGILKSWWGPHKALPLLNKHLVTKQLSFHTHLGPIAKDILLAKACGAFKYVCIRALLSCCQLPIPSLSCCQLSVKGVQPQLHSWLFSKNSHTSTHVLHNKVWLWWHAFAHAWKLVNC